MASDAKHHFTFDLDSAIREQVLRKLKASPLLALAKDAGPKESGIYALFHKGKLVYVGKASKETTKSGRTLRARLNEHVMKIDGRKNISLKEMQCKYLTLDSEWWVFAAEFVLIAYLKPEWNGSGYGSKVPGAGRPGIKVSVWNQMYPLKPGAKDPAINDGGDKPKMPPGPPPTS
jgi:hypothetical protein